VLACKDKIETDVVEGKLPPTIAVQKLIAEYAKTEIGDYIKDTSPFEIK